MTAHKRILERGCKKTDMSFWVACVLGKSVGTSGIHVEKNMDISQETVNVETFETSNLILSPDI